MIKDHEVPRGLMDYSQALRRGGGKRWVEEDKKVGKVRKWFRTRIAKLVLIEK